MDIIHIADQQHIHIAARQFLDLCKSHCFFAFYGDLGAGKTTFIKAVCRELGTKDAVSSPTFSIVNEYHISSDSGKSLIYHMDFYRLKALQEAVDIGIVDYFSDKSAYCFIEWPEIVESLLPEEVVRIAIKPADDNSRMLEIRRPWQ